MLEAVKIFNTALVMATVFTKLVFWIGVTILVYKIVGLVMFPPASVFIMPQTG
jgi:hypothetical protein